MLLFVGFSQGIMIIRQTVYIHHVCCTFDAAQPNNNVGEDKESENRGNIPNERSYRNSFRTTGMTVHRQHSLLRGVVWVLLTKEGVLGDQ